MCDIIFSAAPELIALLDRPEIYAVFAAADELRLFVELIYYISPNLLCINFTFLFGICRLDKATGALSLLSTITDSAGDDARFARPQYRYLFLLLR